jgi:protein gp37
MNKTKIEWTDYTWNPVTGCWGPGGTPEKPNLCSYCYAQRIAQRFFVHFLGDDCTQPRAANHPFCAAHEIRYKKSGGAWRYGFAPTYHPYRLNEPYRIKKPARIFTCSMGDLFGDWVLDHWIEYVLQTARDCPHHIFQFLTKNPKRLKEFNPWPQNCWVGTTVTNQADADERLQWLLKVDASVRIVSHEPLLGAIDLGKVQFPDNYFKQAGILGVLPDKKEPDDYIYFTKQSGIQWAIIGAMTGPGAILPEVDWVMNLAEQYHAAGVPIFLKDNLGFKDQPQEYPA